MKPEFQPGDKVEKKDGYSFRGIVLSVYKKLNGDWRMDVEIPTEDFMGCTCPNCEDPNGAGMIHIFNPEQFKKVQ